MPLYTVFGVNGVGKDSVIREAQQAEPDIMVISETKLLMFGLGIIGAFDSSVTPGREHYLALETTSQSEIQQVEDYFIDILEPVADSPVRTVMTSHLIPAQLLNNSPNYLIKPKPACLHTVGRALINITANPSDVFARRNADERDRGNLEVQDIAEHMGLCGQEWQRLQAEAATQGSSAEFFTIDNSNLLKASEQMLTLIRI